MVNEKLYEEIIVFDEKRAATIIGNKGETKAKIEKITHTVIEINKGIAKISGKDILNIETAVNILSAISIGFTPNNAIKLKELDVFLTQISFKHKNKNRQKVIAGRIIGKQGKIRKKIEVLCDVALLINTSKAYIIGSAKNTGLAKNTIEQIINGSKHRAVINWLQEVSSNKEPYLETVIV
ncbi:MAG: hypothetical protein COW47_01750 [Candidatus Huberarchaeum crystalense]|uniref:K Homology domain-containing protein n=1 Tax=Huberarchaeum crystalense TaxID=2014257 RepID=A0A2G9LJU6_HUBC1|nr:hypothetical protein [archaeon]OIP20538.1 MAG: hypothetical protein AUJ91_01140 [archaeon CG2_30_31_98]PIN66817.1 MAG: hypothetical protein COW69_00295 [Candidatus Huberarchaeum crystalense]NCS98330.1 hypothetical protein [archaeon]PIV13926.1 MAG: hypothetical protein COS45_00015 [Candidatus Huberarchaeum crystalense]